MDAATYLRGINDALVEAQKPIRILRSINWDPKVHERFFAAGCRVLPKPTYPPLGYEPKEKVRELLAIKKQIRGRSEVEVLLRKKCDEFARTVEMLAARETPRFHAISRELYGSPRDPYAGDERVDNLEIARLWASRQPPRNEEATIDSAEACRMIEAIVAPHLGGGIRVRESTRITANAAAGATKISVRKGATFTPRQVRALAHHEGLWHVLTSVNGYAQPVFTVLGVGLPHFTASQEGGAILAEFLTGNLTDDRFRELGERTIAVHMAEEGADFLEVFAYLAGRFPERKAAQMAERVFRGGVLTGGAPFTKDAVYQHGYCAVTNFLRAAFDHGDLSLVQAFLAGKMAVEDAPLVRELIDQGLASGPTFVPAWYRELDSVAAGFTHSVTLDLFDHRRMKEFWGSRARLPAPRTVAARTGSLRSRKRGR